MSRATYWMFFAALSAFIVVGWVLGQPPQPPDLDVQRLEEFYRSQYVLAAGLGLVVGVVLSIIAARRTIHRAKERAADFNGRVVFRGILAAVLAAVLALFFTLAIATVTDLDPYAPSERGLLVAPSLLFFVVLAIAAWTALVSFAATSRFQAWGGQYAVLPRSLAG